MLHDYYERLCSDKIAAFVIEPDGQVHVPDYPGIDLHIIAGSFDPLHTAHKAIYYTIGAHPKLFELSLQRHGKEQLSYEILCYRLSQFAWYAPVLVTNTWRLEDKAKAADAHHCTFHGGYDMAMRLIATEPLEWLGITPLRFVIYQREYEDRIMSIADWAPEVMPKSFIVGHLPSDLERVSSTVIRQTSKS